ncbi:hypothetical protein BDD43_0831 [Mucilaginibacter gracilis]|uniref:Uncharacterized protein n=1 Tax=Mucilaginibacter gracilis TaxID=423350 RepID=A0A495IXV1_9SPHI|nr:hypothetical protein BDD43_0831 [Mucilaginibacter gracilis]
MSTTHRVNQKTTTSANYAGKLIKLYLKFEKRTCVSPLALLGAIVGIVLAFYFPNPCIFGI